MHSKRCLAAVNFCTYFASAVAVATGGYLRHENKAVALNGAIHAHVASASSSHPEDLFVNESRQNRDRLSTVSNHSSVSWLIYNLTTSSSSDILQFAEPMQESNMASFVHGHHKNWDRLLKARQTWGRRAEHFFVLLGEESANTVGERGCRKDQTRISPVSQNVFIEWTCSGSSFSSFTMLQVNCTEGYLDYWTNFCCKYDRAFDYAFSVRPEAFSSIDWFTMGDDDLGFSYPPLHDFLSHYDSNDAIALNPAAATLEEQRQGAGPAWHKAARRCNPVIPQRFMGSVYSRGLLQKCSKDFSSGAFEHLCKNFNGCQDTLLGLFFWTKAAKFLPLGQHMQDTDNIDNWLHRDQNNDTYMAHRVREDKAFQRMEDELKLRYPQPEELPGSKYEDSINAKAHGTIFSLTKETCIPSPMK